MRRISRYEIEDRLGDALAVWCRSERNSWNAAVEDRRADGTERREKPRGKVAAVSFATGLQVANLTDVGMRRTTNQDSLALVIADSAELFREQLGGSRRAVKVALLDQRAVAGIGNLYASEILHLAEVHPGARCDHVTRAKWARIAESTREVLELAIRYEGSTLGDGTYRNALNQAGGYQNHHRVYDRAGEACPRCGGGRVIKRIVQAQRSTFFCAGCQRR